MKLAVLWAVGLGCLGGLVYAVTAEGRALAEEMHVSDTDFCVLKEAEYVSGIYTPDADGYVYYADMSKAEAMAKLGFPRHDGKEYYGVDSAELYWTWFYRDGWILKYTITGVD